MNYITVRHLPRDLFRDMSCTFNDDKRLEIAKEALRNNNYVRVADLVLGGSLSDIKNQAYELTNSIDRPWYMNRDIQVSEQAQAGVRSTSVGDIIQVAGESYMVAGCGFKHIDLED